MELCAIVAAVPRDHVGHGRVPRAEEELLRILDPDLTGESFARLREREARFVQQLPSGDPGALAALDPTDARLAALAADPTRKSDLLDYAAASGDAIIAIAPAIANITGRPQFRRLNHRNARKAASFSRP